MAIKCNQTLDMFPDDNLGGRPTFPWKLSDNTVTSLARDYINGLIDLEDLNRIGLSPTINITCARRPKQLE